MALRPWMKFYPADWQADELLGMCTLAARGLWIEMIGIMHKADPYGHLVVNGRPPTDTQLAALARCPPDQIPSLLDELENAGVFSRTRTRVIYSRRMTRDERRSKDGRNAKIMGAKVPGSRRHQAIENKRQNNSTLKVVDKVVDPPPPPQSPDAQKLESNRPLTGAQSAREVAERLIQIWAEECGGVLKVPIKLTPERIKACAARWKDTFGLDEFQFRAHCQTIIATPFLRGDGGGWRADFDFAISSKGILGIREGKYDGGRKYSSGHDAETAAFDIVSRRH